MYFVVNESSVKPGVFAFFCFLMVSPDYENLLPAFEHEEDPEAGSTSE